MTPGLTCHRCNAPISGERGAPMEADKLGAYGIWGGLDPDERGRLGVES